MFSALSNSLQAVFHTLRGYGRISESNVRDAMREVRLALLEADVNFQVAKDFTERVLQACVGEEVLASITPGEQIVKRVHEEMTALLGGVRRPVDLGGTPSTVILIGLHGSGKTTTAAKLALHWKGQGKNVLLVAADIRRPAAVEQLRTLAGTVGVDILTPAAGESVPALGERALKAAWESVRDVLILDTGGRFQVETELVDELRRLREGTRAKNVLLVVDAAIGQESVHVAETFHREVGLTGLILTKLDGDARGGAALSIQAVTGCPIVFTGTGEHLDDLEPFHPERMASRILGMGDIVTLVEKVQAVAAEQTEEEGEERQRKGRLDLEGFLEQIQHLKKMGPMENLVEMLPLGGAVRSKVREQMEGGGGAQFQRFTKRAEAIVQSMTRRERRHPEILDGSRRRRIARGSGTQVSDVNELLRQFQQARTMMRKFGRLQKRLQFGR